MYKIRGADGKEYGPVNADMIHRWISERRADKDTLVQVEGTNDWRRLSSFAEFAEALARGPQAGRLPPHPPSSGAAPPPRAQTSGLAIASLVLGILGVCTLGIGNFVALLLGVVALNRIKRSGGQLQGRGLALAGIWVSVATLILVPIMLGLIAPSFSKTRGRAQTAKCAENLRQLARAVRLYAADHSDQLPAAANWCDLVEPHLGVPSPWRCPSDGARNRCSYGFNTRLGGREESQINPRTVLLFEMNGGWNASGGRESVSPRHGSFHVVAFVDGSVEQVPAGRLSQLQWEP